MKVEVKWLKSPRQRLGIPRQAGSFSKLDVKEAKRILEEFPGIFESPELDKLKEKPPVVKDTMAYKPRTRPVKREKKD